MLGKCTEPGGVLRLGRVDGFLSGRMKVEVLRSEVGRMAMPAFDSDEASVQGGLDAAEAAPGILVATRPIQLVSVLVVHPELVLPEYQH